MKKVLLRIAEETDSISPTELAEFLILLQGATVALDQVLPPAYPRDREVMPIAEIEAAKYRIATFLPRQLDSLFDPEKAKHLLRIEGISKQSPLVIIVIGSLTLLTLAVIFSGGKLEIIGGLIKADLPPLGRGVKSLKEALGLNKRVSARFGIREVTVKLNGAEYKELAIDITGAGGFQSFFRGLQNRVNKSNKKLTLSPEDLDRICRHMAHPEKGGWQARLKKIFGRHLLAEQTAKRPGETQLK